MHDPTDIADLLLAIESEPKILAVAIPAIRKKETFTSIELAKDISDCCKSINDSRWMPKPKTMLSACEELEEYGVLEQHSNKKGNSHNAKVFRFTDGASIYRKAAFFSLDFLADKCYSIYSFLGRFHRHNKKAHDDIKQWYKSMIMIAGARYSKDQPANITNYLTTSQLSVKSGIPHATLYRRLLELEQAGYVELEVENGEMGRLTQESKEFMENSQSAIDKDLIRFMQYHGIISNEGNINGMLVNRNQVYESLRKWGHTKLSVERRITHLKKKGLYVKEHHNNHQEVRLTEKGNSICRNLLLPIARLSSRHYDPDLSNFPEKVYSAVVLYARANPNIRDR